VKENSLKYWLAWNKIPDIGPKRFTNYLNILDQSMLPGRQNLEKYPEY